MPTHGSRRLAIKAARAMPVPALILESPASALTLSEVDEIAIEFAVGATVRTIDAPAASFAVPEIVGQRAGLRLSSSLS